MDIIFTENTATYEHYKRKVKSLLLHKNYQLPDILADTIMMYALPHEPPRFQHGEIIEHQNSGRKHMIEGQYYSDGCWHFFLSGRALSVRDNIVTLRGDMKRQRVGDYEFSLTKRSDDFFPLRFVSFNAFDMKKY